MNQVSTYGRFQWEDFDLEAIDVKGGPGSGFRGHAGIPGHRGGSQARSGGHAMWTNTPRLRPGDVAGEGFVFYNTNAKTVDLIERHGMDAGSFTDRPIDFGGNTWLAVHRDRLPDYQEHQYDKVMAQEPAWEQEDYATTGRRNRIQPTDIYIVDRRGKVTRRLGEPLRRENITPKLNTPGAKIEFGIGGSDKNFKIATPQGAETLGMLGTDFENEYTVPTRGEVFFTGVPAAARRRGLGSSLTEDALRVLVANGMQTVNLHAVSPEGRALVASLVRRGLVKPAFRVSSVGKGEHEFGQSLLGETHRTRKGGPGSGFRGHRGIPGHRGGSQARSGHQQEIGEFLQEKIHKFAPGDPVASELTNTGGQIAIVYLPEVLLIAETPDIEHNRLAETGGLTDREFDQSVRLRADVLGNNKIRAWVATDYAGVPVSIVGPESDEIAEHHIAKAVGRLVAGGFAKDSVLVWDSIYMGTSSHRFSYWARGAKMIPSKGSRAWKL